MKIKIESAPEKVIKEILKDISSGKLKPGINCLTTKRWQIIMVSDGPQLEKRSTP